MVGEPQKFIRPVNSSMDAAKYQQDGKQPAFPVKETRTSLLRRNVILTKQLETVVTEVNKYTHDGQTPGSALTSLEGKFIPAALHKRLN